MNKPKIIRLALANLMKTIGISIYVLFRKDIVFFEWISPTLLKPLNMDNHFWGGHFIVYCLPDGLWYFALLLFQSTFLENKPSSKLLFYFSILLPFALEILQLYGITPGTFDLMDIATYILTLIIFFTFAKLSCVTKERNY